MWYFLFKNGIAEMVRMASSREEAVNKFEKRMHYSWNVLSKDGYECIEENEITAEKNVEMIRNLASRLKTPSEPQRISLLRIREFPQFPQIGLESARFMS